MHCCKWKLSFPLRTQEPCVDCLTTSVATSRSLTSLGVESKSYGNLLCSVLLNKIPAELQLIVSRKVSESDWNLDLVINAIKEEITARERGSARDKATRRNEHRTPPTATALVSAKYIKCTNTLLLLQPAPFPGRLRYCHAS